MDPDILGPCPAVVVDEAVKTHTVCSGAAQMEALQREASSLEEMVSQLRLVGQRRVPV